MDIDLTNAKPCADCRQCLTTTEKCSYCTERDQLRRELAEALEQLETASATNHEYAIAAIPAVGAWVSAHPGQKAPKLDEVVSWVCRQLAEARDENRRSGDRLMEQMAIDGKLASELAKAEAKRDGYRAKMEEFEDKWATAEQQLAEARRDGEDLDWLENRAYLAYRQRDPEFGDLVDHHVVVDEDAKGTRQGHIGATLRAAIRAARGAK